MHQGTMNIMEDLVNRFLDKDAELKIADIGSYDYNGSYKKLLDGPDGWEYTGIDVSAGPNVDIVVPELDNWDAIADESFDVVISGQCLEHVKMPWKLVKQAYRITKPGGHNFHIAPHTWGQHRFPLDCWRIFPDGMRVLMTEVVAFKELECKLDAKNTWFAGCK